MSIEVGVEFCVGSSLMFAKVLDSSSQGPHCAGMRVAAWGKADDFAFYPIFLLSESQAGKRDLVQERDGDGRCGVIDVGDA